MIEVHGLSRQAFLLRATLAAGTAYGATMVSPLVSRALAQDGGGDIDVVNYALTLEYLEADFYTRAAKQAKGLRSDERRLVVELRDNEVEHVDALRATVQQLGGTPVKEPAFTFGGAFASRTAFLKTANTLEDTGVSAYNGAAPRLESKEVLVAAGGIAQVEARHAALIRLARGKPPAPLAFDLPSSEEKVRAAIKPLIRRS
jgi:rubrerythrin